MASVLGMNRLLRGVAALSVSTAPRVTLVRAASSLPGNLALAEEKPMTPPRVIPAAQQVKTTASGHLELQLLSLADDASELGAVTVDGEVFGAPSRVDILQRVVRWQLANRRAGTNKTKTRTEVSGSTRKPWKQKGSGRARVGDIRAPQWRGGYRVHGPVLRDFSYSLPKKVRAMGLRVALSTKLREGKLAIVDSLDVDVRG
jgi:large subunit ribosomal protein L4